MDYSSYIVFLLFVVIFLVSFVSQVVKEKKKKEKERLEKMRVHQRKPDVPSYPRPTVPSVRRQDLPQVRREISQFHKKAEAQHRHEKEVRGSHLEKEFGFTPSLLSHELDDHLKEHHLLSTIEKRKGELAGSRARLTDDAAEEKQSPVSQLIKRTNLQEMILLAEILNRPY